MIVKKFSFVVIVFFIILLNSCDQKGINFYKKNSTKLAQLAGSIEKNQKLDTLPYCCISEKSCLDIEEEDIMKSLGINCVSKDTSAGVISFTISDGNLKKTELIYLYNSKKPVPISYPDAGVKVKRIKDNWFLEVYTFD